MVKKAGNQTQLTGSAEKCRPLYYDEKMSKTVRFPENLLWEIALTPFVINNFAY